jgi:alpha-N-arabinofuranosidase
LSNIKKNSQYLIKEKGSMNCITAKLTIAKEYIIGKTDDRLFGSFVEHMGSTVYGGIFQPDHPSSDRFGFRRDTLNALRELQLSVIRYPGGNFVSGFNWKDSIGQKNTRPKRLDIAWKALENNQFGLDEFMKWIGLLGCSAIQTINLGTGGMQSAIELLEYCNMDTDTEYAQLRKRNGRIKPYNIKTWCLGNEMDGPWQIAGKTANEYGRLALETGKIMKMMDPTVELIISGSSTSRMDTFPEWDKDILMHCYDIADYISLHHYVDRTCPPQEISKKSYFRSTEKPVFLDTPTYLARTLNVEQQIKDIIATCDYVKAVRRSPKTMYLCFDEWNTLSTNKYTQPERTPWQIGEPIDYVPHTMEDALVAASIMMAILRHADRVKIACQSLLVNTGGLVFTSRDGGLTRNTLFYPFLHLSLYGRGVILRNNLISPVYNCEEKEGVPSLDSLTILDAENSILNIFAVNRTSNTIQLLIDARDFGDATEMEQIIMRNDNLRACNVIGKPETVFPSKIRQLPLGEKKPEVILSPYSWNVVRIKYRETTDKNF